MEIVGLGAGILFVMAFWFVVLALKVWWILMLINAAKRERWAWFVIMLLFSLLPAILYRLVDYERVTIRR